MTIETFFMKRYDRAPPYRLQVINSSGTPEDISGATVVFAMKNKTTNVIVNSGTSDGCSLSFPTSGIIDYDWQASDTVEAGVFKIEFEITPSAGRKYTVPAKDENEAIVHIGEDLNNG